MTIWQSYLQLLTQCNALKKHILKMQSPPKSELYLNSCFQILFFEWLWFVGREDKDCGFLIINLIIYLFVCEALSIS